MYLNDKTIRNAKPQAKPYKLSDGEGLYLLIQPGGSKLWRMKYRFGGKENCLSFGKYPEVSLVEARDSRYKARKLLREHTDPNSQKKEARHAALFDSGNTFRAVAQGWYNTNKTKWTQEHAERIWRRIEIHAMHELGNRPIVQIKTPDLVTVIRKVEKKKKPETAFRLIRTLYAVFRYGIHCGILEHNPAADLKGIIIAPAKTHFAAIHPSELPDLLDKLDAVRTTNQNRIAVKLLLHVFVRPGELRFGKWAEIDFENKLWTIPPERMKKRRPHIVPLSGTAIELLQELHCLTGYSEYLFPSQQRRRHPVMSENTINKVLRNMGYEGKQVGHGFRAIASTVLNESALFRPDVIEAQLAHVEENGSRKPYNRAQYMDERIPMMEWWSNYLNTTRKASGNTMKQAG